MKKYLIPVYVLLAFIFAMLIACSVYFLNLAIPYFKLLKEYGPSVSVYEEDIKSTISLILYGTFALVAAVADFFVVALISIKELPIFKSLREKLFKDKVAQSEKLKND